MQIQIRISYVPCSFITPYWGYHGVAPFLKEVMKWSHNLCQGRLLPRPFLVHCNLFVLSLDAMQSEVMKLILNKPDQLDG